MIYSSLDVEHSRLKLVIMGIFCPFTRPPPPQQKKKKRILKKKKKGPGYIILHMHTKNHNHMRYSS